MNHGVRPIAVVVASAVALVVPLAGGGSARAAAARCDRPAWVTAWAAAPLAAGETLGGRTVRHLVQIQVGGTAIRLRVTNRFGTTPLRLDALTVGFADAALIPDGPAVMRAATAPGLRDAGRSVRFNGRSTVAVPAGADRWSDSISLPVQAGDDLVVSVHAKADTARRTMLAGATEATSGWTAAGDRTADRAGTAYGAASGWSVVSGIDVLPRVPTALVVAFGDSLTEGYGSTRDGDRRYTDVLAERLRTGGGRFTVANLGISANRLVPTAHYDGIAPGGPAGLDRFERDVLGQSGATDLLVMLGVNDVSISTPTAKVIAGYRSLVAKARAAGLRVIGGTLPPSGDLLSGDPLGRGSAPTEAGRAVLNQWIRTSRAFDAVVDFDAAVRDPSSPNHWRSDLGVDGLHPNDFGYRRMAEAIDLSLFRGFACR